MPNNLCHRELEKAYKAYNARYFLGALPDDCDIMFAPMDGCIAYVELDKNGWVITIDPKYSIEGRLWRMHLLHEMAHIAVSPYRRHGKPFQNVMHALVAMGAYRDLW